MASEGCFNISVPANPDVLSSTTQKFTTIPLLYPTKIKRIPNLALVRTVAELIALVKHFHSISGSWGMFLNHLVDRLGPTVEGQIHQSGDSGQSG